MDESIRFCSFFMNIFPPTTLKILPSLFKFVSRVFLVFLNHLKRSTFDVWFYIYNQINHKKKHFKLSSCSSSLGIINGVVIEVIFMNLSRSWLY